MKLIKKFKTFSCYLDPISMFRSYDYLIAKCNKCGKEVGSMINNLPAPETPTCPRCGQKFEKYYEERIDKEGKKYQQLINVIL